MTLVAALSIVMACGDGGASTPEECDSKRPCLAGMTCLEELGRCTATAPDVESALLEVRVTGEDRVPRLHASILGAEALTEPEIGIDLGAAVSVRGRVLAGTDPRAISATISVRVLLPDAPATPRIDLRSLLDPGPDGIGFRIDLPAHGQAVFEAHADRTDLPPAVVTRDLVPNLPTVQVTFRSEDQLSRLALRVVDDEGAPLNGCLVTVDDARGSRVSGRARTDAAGRTTLLVKGDAAPPLRLRVEDVPGVPGGWRTEIFEVGTVDVVRGADLGDIVVPISEPTAVTVQLVGRRDGVDVGAIPAAVVTATRVGPGLAQVVRTSTDDVEGVARLDLQPGVYVLTAVPPPKHPFGLATRAITVDEGGQTEFVRVISYPRRRVDGVVRDVRGLPVRQLRVIEDTRQRLEGLDSVALQRATWDFTATDGSFTLWMDAAEPPLIHEISLTPSTSSTVPPTVHQLTVRRPASGTTSALRTEIRLPPPLVRTFVVRDEEGEPLADASVRLSWRVGGETGRVLSAVGQTDEEGRTIIVLPGRI